MDQTKKILDSSLKALHENFVRQQNSTQMQENLINDLMDDVKMEQN